MGLNRNISSLTTVSLSKRTLLRGVGIVLQAESSKELRWWMIVVMTGIVCVFRCVRLK
jgi:hypothetical protein